VAEGPVEAELVDVEPVDAMWVEAELPPRVRDEVEEEPSAELVDEAVVDAELVDETEPVDDAELVDDDEQPIADAELVDETEAAADETEPVADETEPVADETEPDPETPNAEPADDERAAEVGAGGAGGELGAEAAAGGSPEREEAPEPAGTSAAVRINAPSVGDAQRKVIRQRADGNAVARNRRADPEEVLAAYPWAFDAETLREQIDDPDQMWVVVDRLTDKLEYAERDAVRARLLSLRAVAERLVGDLDAALEDARAALTHAEATGELRRTAIVQARLAHVLQWRGEYAEADRLYAEAGSPELPSRLRAEIHELAGRSAFDQGRYLEAMNHFETSLDLRKGADPELVERIEAALDTITRKTTADGSWGPYPRTSDEILGRTEPPRPIRDQQSGLWGYVGAVPPRYAQAQPFADGLAWVRRPESPAWELIDLAGETVIDASSGYLAAERFAEGLAWVSRDEAGGWYAIDRQNRLIVPGGFDDAKAFHHGLALVKRGGWGVIDRHGRMVVPPRFRGFVTPLVSGGPIEGFTDEGLAVVDAGDDRFGVVDRAGQLIVTPEHAAVVIHPVAFLVADRFGLWGALDRQGGPLVELKYKEQADVLEELDRLLTDGRPVL
jgi:tetratricopeptide (TPR) repeat protein